MVYQSIRVYQLHINILTRADQFNALDGNTQVSVIATTAAVTAILIATLKSLFASRPSLDSQIASTIHV